jgi:hypothetical protein
MNTSDDEARDPRAPEETYNPWTIVNLVFRHLAEEGLHPVLGDFGDPGAPAAALLKAFGITPHAEGNRNVSDQVRDDLARLRAAYEADRLSGRAPEKPDFFQADKDGHRPTRMDKWRPWPSCLRLRAKRGWFRGAINHTRTFPAREGCR